MLLEKEAMRENTPNAGKLISSLRNTGYNNVSAIADLVDNSIDAMAQNVRINVVPTSEGDFRITIADDGQGMSEQILDQAMRLGSDTERDENSDLGKFGMGLITASISIARRLKVITCYNGTYLTAVQDLDEVAEMGKFVKELRASTDEEKRIFMESTKNAEHGTVLILEKCDRLQNKNINELCKHIATQLGQIFRMFINDKDNIYARKIYVRGSQISPVDPLWLNHEETEEFSDDEFTIDVGDHTEKVRVRLVALPEFDQVDNRKYGINQKNQGFYVMRNNREIAAGEDLGVFMKHNSFNRLRMEIFFSANVDNAMGVNFTKRDIKPNQEIVDKIKRIVDAQLVSFKKRVAKSKAAKNSENIDHISAAKAIAAKSNILINPKEKYAPRVPAGGQLGNQSATGGDNSKESDESKSGPMSKMNCEFQLRSNGVSGNLFEPEQVGKRVIVYYNIEHPFYQQFIAPNKDNVELINTIDFLIYSLASAQLVNQSVENADLFDNFNAIFSSNLRTLIN